MQVKGPVKVIALLFSLCLESSASRMQKIINEKSDRARDQPGELVKSINSLNWLIRLLQDKSQLSYRLKPNYVQVLASLDDCESKDSPEKHTIKTTNELFCHIMMSGSMADKIKIIQAMDPLLNDATATHLIHYNAKVKQLPNWMNPFSSDKPSNPSHLIDSKDISTAMGLLTIGNVKIINKDSANAKILLCTDYRLTDVVAVDSSIWFLLTLLQFHPGFLEGCPWMIDYIAHIVDSKIILRADVDIRRLIFGMRKSKSLDDWSFRWWSYIVKVLPINDQDLCATEDIWKMVSNSLILNDSRLVRETLDANLLSDHRGVRNYLLLLKDNSEKRLLRCDPRNSNEMYSCFIFTSNFELELDSSACVREIPKEKLAELNFNLIKLNPNKESSRSIGTQLRLSYLNLGLLFGGNGTIFNISYARVFAQIPETFELLDTFNDTKLGESFDGKYFSTYMLENHNWDEAAGKHFHYFISYLMINNREKMIKSLVEYVGTDIYEALMMLKPRYLTYICHTLDKVPRLLNNYFKVIDEQTRERPIDPSKRLEIATLGSLFNGKTAKRDFVHYQLKEASLDYFYVPIFVDLARIRYKDNRHKALGVERFLHFERIVHCYFPSMARMDIEKGFQKLANNDTFSVALREFIIKNFIYYQFPFVLEDLSSLEEEMFKYNPEIAMSLRVDEMPKMALLRAMYMAFADPCRNLKLAFMKHFLNTKVLYKSLT